MNLIMFNLIIILHKQHWNSFDKILVRSVNYHECITYTVLFLNMFKVPGNTGDFKRSSKLQCVKEWPIQVRHTIISFIFRFSFIFIFYFYDFSNSFINCSVLMINLDKCSQKFSYFLNKPWTWHNFYMMSAVFYSSKRLKQFNCLQFLCY